MKCSSTFPRWYHITLAVSVLINIFFLSLWIFRKPEPPKSVEVAKDHSIEKKRILGKRAKENIQKLKTLGYLPFYKKAPKKMGITRYIKGKAYEGLNLYSSAHAIEAVLMDMEGNILHKWSVELPVMVKELNPKISDKDLQSIIKHPMFFKISHSYWWNKLHLFENGDIFGLIPNGGLIKLDMDSNIRWKYIGRVHHQMHCDNDGRIFVLENQKRFDPKYNKNESFLDDLIVILDKNGKKIGSVSILDALANSDYAPLLSKMIFKGDVFHTNTISPLDNKFIKKSPAFKRGNFLISCRELNLVCIIDFRAQKVVWGLSNMWKAQHQPEILDNGHMLIYDNRWRPNRSRIVEFDPFSQQVYWSYSGTGKDPFYSSIAGAFQRLPNGNTLIVETETGRAFEVTSSGEIVWEFISPHRLKNKENKQFIFSLFEMTRIDQDFVENFIPNISKNNR